VEPVPETSEALAQLAEGGGTAAATALAHMGQAVREVVPACVGLSLGLFEDHLTFTLVSSDQDIAALDAVQYLDGGPCVDAAHLERSMAYHSADPLNEDRWRLFAQASAAAGIASTLSLPIIREERVVGTVNLYAATPQAFDHHHKELAAVTGSRAEGAVTNADLPFRTRLAAAETSEKLRGRDSVDLALGVIVESQRVSFPIAAERLREAAARAGITEAQAARAISRILLGDD
jgi:GAF domain-containing protein